MIITASEYWIQEANACREEGRNSLIKAAEYRAKAARARADATRLEDRYYMQLAADYEAEAAEADLRVVKSQDTARACERHASKFSCGCTVDLESNRVNYCRIHEKDRPMG